MTTVDLNCDMGEGFGPWTMGDDDAMLEIVTSINVACGQHAGDPSIMRRVAGQALAKGVGLGAHPGFADLQGFGRRRLPDVTPREVEELVATQIGALMGAAALEGARVTHVKAHGALSNMACEARPLADAVARAIRAVDPALVFVVLPGTELERAGAAAGLPMARELFADRAYMDDLTLMPRGRPGAVLHDAEAIAARVVAMVRDGAVIAASGARIPVAVDTICVHGDTPGAVAIARAVRAGLEAAGIAVRRFG